MRVRIRAFFGREIAIVKGEKKKRFIKGESFPTSVYILCLKDKIRRMHYQLLHGAEGGWVWDLFE